MPVPDEISNEEAVLIEPAAVALHAILRKEPQVNDKVLIVGAGIIGLLILYTIKQLQPGCQVSVIARHNYQQKMAKELLRRAFLFRHTGIITACCFAAPVGHVSIYFRSS